MISLRDPKSFWSYMYTYALCQFVSWYFGKFPAWLNIDASLAFALETLNYSSNIHSNHRTPTFGQRRFFCKKMWTFFIFNLYLQKSVPKKGQKFWIVTNLFPFKKHHVELFLESYWKFFNPLCIPISISIKQKVALLNFWLSTNCFHSRSIILNVSWNPEESFAMSLKRELLHQTSVEFI